MISISHRGSHDIRKTHTGARDDEVADAAGAGQPRGHGGGDDALREIVQRHGHITDLDPSINLSKTPKYTVERLCLDSCLKPRTRVTKGGRDPDNKPDLCKMA